MHIALLQQFAPDRLPSSALEKDIIRHDHRGSSVDFEQRLDMLDKIQLLVAGAGPEIIPYNHARFAFLATLLVHEGDAALAPKRGIGKHHVKILAGMAAQAVNHANRGCTLFVAAHAVQEEVHHAEARSIVNDLPA